MKKNTAFFILLCLALNYCFPQNIGSARIDSLTVALNKAGEDTAKVTLLNALGFEWGTADFEKARKYLNDAGRLAEKIGFKKGLGDACSNLSLVYELQGNYFESLNLQIKALKIREEINDRPGISASIHYIGDIYFSQSELTEKASLSKEYNDKALENYFKSLKIAEEIADKNSLANGYNCIGNAYREKGRFEEALGYYFKAVKLRQEENNKRRLAQTYGQMGKLYLEKKEYDNALNYLFKSLKLCEETGYRRTNVKTLGTVGNVYLEQKNYDKALEYCNKSLSMSREIGFLEFVAKANYSISRIYAATGFKEHNGDKALAYYKAYIGERDSINTKNADQAELQFDFDRKVAAAKIEQEKKDLLVKAESKKQKLIILFVVVGLLFALAFAGFIFRSLQIRNKQNEIISEQKHLVEEKHKEITDSINYAERIQRSFLATKQILDKNLNEYFVLFKPKDVVSGDFYWAAELNNGHFAFVVADSTGHGVPGAIMSLLNITSLEKAVEHHDKPSEILTHTRHTIIERLKKDGSSEGGKDGMDCCLLDFDFKNKQLLVSAAQNPVWIVRHNADKIELTETAYDKMPVGKYDREQVSFTQQVYPLQKGDMVYAATDGFADQFGGPRGKKFMQKRLKELLISISNKTADQQKEILLSSLNAWVGELEQVDDITIAGIRIG